MNAGSPVTAVGVFALKQTGESRPCALAYSFNFWCVGYATFNDPVSLSSTHYLVFSSICLFVNIRLSSFFFTALFPESDAVTQWSARYSHLQICTLFVCDSVWSHIIFFHPFQGVTNKKWPYHSS